MASERAIDRRVFGAVDEAIGQFHMGNRPSSSDLERLVQRAVLEMLEAGSQVALRPRYQPLMSFFLLMRAYDQTAAIQAHYCHANPRAWLATRHLAGGLVRALQAYERVQLANLDLRGTPPEDFLATINGICDNEMEIFAPGSRTATSANALWVSMQCWPQSVEEGLTSLNVGMKCLLEDEAELLEPLEALGNTLIDGSKWLRESRRRLCTTMLGRVPTPDEWTSEYGVPEHDGERQVLDGLRELARPLAEVPFHQQWCWSWTRRMMDVLLSCVVLRANTRIEECLRLGAEATSQTDDDLDVACLTFIQSVAELFDSNDRIKKALAFTSVRGLCDYMIGYLVTRVRFDRLIGDYADMDWEANQAEKLAWLGNQMIKQSAHLISEKDWEELTDAQRKELKLCLTRFKDPLMEAATVTAIAMSDDRASTLLERFPRQPGSPDDALELLKKVAEEPKE